MPMSARSSSLAEVLDEMTTERAEELTERLSGGDVRCYACGHRCLIHEGKRGICKVRFNERGRLLVPSNYVAALACDPTEKKPFFHAHLRHARLRPSLRVLPELVDQPGATRRRGGDCAARGVGKASGRDGARVRGASGGVELQRAFDYGGVGGRGF